MTGTALTRASPAELAGFVGFNGLAALGLGANGLNGGSPAGTGFTSHVGQPYRRGLDVERAVAVPPHRIGFVVGPGEARRDDIGELFLVGAPVHVARWRRRFRRRRWDRADGPRHQLPGRGVVRRVLQRLRRMADRLTLPPGVEQQPNQVQA